MSETAVHNAPTGSTSTAPAEVPPPLELNQEVRFAVVMYGGVSLAIYINGVAQELLELVRATAPDPAAGARPSALFSDARLRGAGPVYRKLGQILGRDDPPGAEVGTLDPIHTRFVVDVISGTSAGGINGVYLAKALANEQSIDDLKALWLNQGDLAKLLNDAESLEGGLVGQKPPASLLNSQRMYRELVQALENMDGGHKDDDPPTESRFVDELDLYVTTTDLQGLRIDLRLADKSVPELRHRNVFHFRYAGPAAPSGAASVSDFGKAHNPMLAFAARCTSSFPVAFDAMQLADADPVLVTLDRPPRLLREGAPPPWAAFFPDYMDEPGLPSSAEMDLLWTRSFADGGYLDNKPFGYAIDALARRHSRLPVSRKLLYVEPDPEEVRKQLAVDPRPNAIQNGMLASGLARHETIREDLERILARNRLAERMERVLAGVELDVLERQRSTSPIERRHDYGSLDLADMIAVWGVSYGGYHRLKVSAVTDEIAEMVRDALKLDVHSDDFLAVRSLVRAWRDRHFVALRSEDHEAPPRQTENRFLEDYDLSYRVRRLDFTLGRLERLYCLDAAAQAEMARHDTRWPVTPEERAAFREALAQLRVLLDGARRTLERERAELHVRGGKNPLAPFVSAVMTAAQSPTAADAPARADERSARSVAAGRVLAPLLEPTTERERQLAASRFIAGAVGAALERAAEELRRRIGEASNVARIMVGEAFARAARAGSLEAAALNALQQYYDTFEYYDVATFPALFGTDVGEERSTVDVFRVSRKDATLRPELRLAGASFGHFGAFLDRRWRWNDILWGRLDGADRIIAALLPGESQAPLRSKLTEEAHTRILVEELTRGAKMGVVGDAAAALAAPDGTPAAPGRPVLPPAVARLVEEFVAGRIQPERLYRYFADLDGYDVDRRLDPEPTMRMAGRAARVSGRILDGIGKSDGKENLSKWAARGGTLLWGLVEVAVPGSLVGGFFRHWAKLLLAFSALLLGFGVLLGNGELTRLGGLIFGVTAVARLGSAALAQVVKGRWRALLPVAVAVAVAILGLAGYGLYVLTRGGVPGQPTLGTPVLGALRSVASGAGALLSPVLGFLGRSGPTRFTLSTLLIVAAGAFGWFFGRRGAGGPRKPGRIRKFFRGRLARWRSGRLLGAPAPVLPENAVPVRAGAWTRVRGWFHRG